MHGNVIMPFGVFTSDKWKLPTVTFYKTTLNKNSSFYFPIKAAALVDVEVMVVTLLFMNGKKTYNLYQIIYLAMNVVRNEPINLISSFVINKIFVQYITNKISTKENLKTGKFDKCLKEGN